MSLFCRHADIQRILRRNTVPGVKRLNKLLKATNSQTELNKFATPALREYRRSMIPTTPETAGLYVSACHRVEDAESAKRAVLGTHCTAEFNTYWSVADGAQLGLHHVGHKTYRRTMVESSKAGDIEGVLELYQNAVQNGMATDELLHIAIRCQEY